MTAMELVREASDRFYAALNGMFEGTLEPMWEVWSHEDDVTILDPLGGWHAGWDDVRGWFEGVGGMGLGGHVAVRDLLVRTEGTLGFAVGVVEGEHAGPEGETIPIKQRATGIFRLEDGEWRLIHYHTDVAPLCVRAFGDLAGEFAWGLLEGEPARV